MALIGSLGYVRIRATDMDAWRKFAFETIGFAKGSGPEPGALYLRMDERPGRIILLPGEEDRVDAVGWEVRDHLVLRQVQAALEAAGAVGCDGLLVDKSYYTAEEITADSYWGHNWDFS
jgi:3,4-dihydroxy-9,10-secoandrosta-1,3,5(10)-triene-9,17-dione 4,5-dioxygenase